MRIKNEDSLRGLYDFAFGDPEDAFTMPIEQVNEELRDMGIDPDEVERRVRDRLAELGIKLPARKDRNAETRKEDDMSKITDTDVGGVIRAYLERNDYDGLVECDGECGCQLDDLAPCGQIRLDCRPAYKGAGEGGYDFVMYANKEGADASFERARDLSALKDQTR